MADNDKVVTTEIGRKRPQMVMDGQKLLMMAETIPKLSEMVANEP